MIACRNGHVEICKLLLDNGANINAKTTKSQRTPLLIAAYWGHEEIARILLARGADILARDEDGTANRLVGTKPGRIRACQVGTA